MQVINVYVLKFLSIRVCWRDFVEIRIIDDTILIMNGRKKNENYAQEDCMLEK